MSRKFFGIEKGHDVYAENGDLLFRMLSGTAAPDGLLDQSSAPIGSLYVRSGTGEFYQKIANAGNAADWQLNGASAAVIGNWRPEKVNILTNDTQGAGVRDIVASPFSDDDSPVLTISDFVVGEYIISDADGTPALLEITNVSSPNVTFAAATNPLVSNDTFVVPNYLPDSPGSMEGQAIANYNGTIMVKIGDIDWDFATGINLSSGYAAGNGSITSADSVESAIEKLDGNQIDLITLSGVAQGSVNLGAFTGNVLTSATDTIKQALQRVADYVDNNILKRFSASGITTATTVASFLVDDIKSGRYMIEAVLDSDNSVCEYKEISFIHDGTPSADATSVDDSVGFKLKHGNPQMTVNTVLNGLTGTSQAVDIEVSAPAAISVKLVVIEVL